jgi:hypothetical protein
VEKQAMLGETAQKVFRVRRDCLHEPELQPPPCQPSP